MSVPPHLTRKTVALIGLMGVGKSTIGRRLALAMGLPFYDADAEIEAAAGQSISNIFAELGEGAFRDGERRVIARLLEQPPHVLATGGGAFAQPRTRDILRQGAVTVWLKADLDILARRVGRRDNRPLVAGKDPMAVLEAHARERYPHFATADLEVEVGEAAHQVAVEAIISALSLRMAACAP
jgi:shikimate kinase